MVSAEADSEPLSDVAKELAGVVEGAGARCSNEDARWIVDKLVERGWVDIAGAFHDAAQAEINSDKKARLEKSKQAFLANINEAMRARVESALLARDVIYGSGHSDQPEA